MDTIITFCGSFKFENDMNEIGDFFNRRGYLVLFPEKFDGSRLSLDQIEKFHDIHKRKIDVADIVYIINRNDYIGKDTKAEIDYAKSIDKPIMYAFPHMED